MIFSTQCPSCEANFPIDSAKVPDDGVYARCSQCDGVFLVEVPTPAAVGAPTEGLAATPDFGAPAPTDESATDFSDDLADDLADDMAGFDQVDEDFAAALAEPSSSSLWETSAPAAEAEAAPEAAEHMAVEPAAEALEPTFEPSPAPEPAAPEPAPEPVPAAPVATPTFGKRDPKERAQRLARVLVSDMIAYHPDRHRKSLDQGTLKADFEEEIDKSWHEYVDQCGKEMAESTEFFTEALNEILAKGASVF